MGRLISYDKRIGTVNKNKHGSIMEVVKYNDFNNILVKFEKGNLVHTSWQAFCNGNVKNVYDRSVYGIGFLGEGKHEAFVNKKRTPSYATWQSMLLRCYDDKYHKSRPTYKECYVSDEWHNFQNFAEWYEVNYYEIEGETMSLDKDILVKGNKIYSPDTCVFLPRRINSLFIKNNKKRGDFPIGVTFDSKRNAYMVNCSFGDRHSYFGKHNTPEDAFKVYKKYKETIIKQMAEEYKNKIPLKLYNAMIKYEVHIKD